ncbi:glycosyltransferase family 2 protein [Pedobacter psychrotolerans]|uniref:glycosyltransferase family 2 protein n=1 Tax=Pedobacter psychrotolerans TaxID=1843235 RepID=UPI003F9626A6
MIDVSIIIVNYNTTSLTLQCIDSIIEHTVDVNYEIIVVDNASEDRSIQGILQKYKNIKLILNNINEGFGRANNLAIQVAKGEFIFLLNSDAYLISNSIQYFLGFMRNPDNKVYGVCGGELLTGNSRETVSYGNFPTLFSLFSMFGLYLFFKDKYKKKYLLGVVNYSNEVKDVDFISGAAMFIRKNVLDIVGLFDRDFFLYFEETELSFRIKKAGFKSVILPEAKIIHLEGGSQSNDQFNYTRYYTFVVSRQLFYKKCYNVWYAKIAKCLHLLHTCILSILGKENGNILKKLKIILNA